MRLACLIELTGCVVLGLGCLRWCLRLRLRLFFHGAHDAQKWSVHFGRFFSSCAQMVGAAVAIFSRWCTKIGRCTLTAFFSPCSEIFGAAGVAKKHRPASAKHNCCSHTSTRPQRLSRSLANTMPLHQVLIPTGASTSPDALNTIIHACGLPATWHGTSHQVELCCEGCNTVVTPFHVYSLGRGSRAKLDAAINLRNQMASRRFQKHRKQSCQSHAPTSGDREEAAADNCKTESPSTSVFEKQRVQRPDAESELATQYSESHSSASSDVDLPHASPQRLKHDAAQTQALISTATACSAASRKYTPLTVDQYAALLPRDIFPWEAAGLAAMQDFIFKLDARSPWRREGRRMNQVEASEVSRGEDPERCRNKMLDLPFKASSYYVKAGDRWPTFVFETTMVSNLVKYHLNPFMQCHKYANRGIEPDHYYH